MIALTAFCRRAGALARWRAQEATKAAAWSIAWLRTRPGPRTGADRRLGDSPDSRHRDEIASALRLAVRHSGDQTPRHLRPHPPKTETAGEMPAASL